MSYDLEVYSPREDALTKVELARELRAQGWAVRFLKIVDYTEVSNPTNSCVELLESVGRLDSGTYLLGWRLQDQKASSFNQLFTEHGLSWIQKQMPSHYGSCYIDSQPYNFALELDATEIAELDSSQPEYLAELRQARFAYTVTRYAGRSDLSVAFCEVVWRALGSICGGMLYEPQAKKTEFVQTSSASTTS